MHIHPTEVIEDSEVKATGHLTLIQSRLRETIGNVGAWCKEKCLTVLTKIVWYGSTQKLPRTVDISFFVQIHLYIILIYVRTKTHIYPLIRKLYYWHNPYHMYLTCDLSMKYYQT